MAERVDAARAMKRRGILAAAGAVVAGIAVKQTARPVAAATDTNFTATGGTGSAFSTSGSGYTFGVNVDGTTYGVYAFSVSGTGVVGSSNSGTGVVGGSVSGYGVNGVSDGGHGVVGKTLGPDGQGYVGVYGFGKGSGTAGVLGDCSFGGNTTTGNAAVQGINAQYGVIGNVNNAPNTIAVWGSNTSTGSAPIGVRGDCVNGIGIYGSTSAAGQFGVIGQALVANAFGLAGIANTDGSAAFAGGTTNANAFAASFQGHVQVFDGAFDVVGAGNKHAIVPHPDGTHRTIYCVESPECWVEDFGEGTLVAGKADIALDKEFAALVHTDTYHVFVMEHDQHNDLHVTNRTAAGFTVQADAATLVAKGKSAAQVSGTFSWRVVARPKTDAKVERLAKATLAPKIDMSKLPGKPTPPSPVAPVTATTPPSSLSVAPAPHPAAAPTQQPAASPPSTGNAPNPLPLPRP